MLEIIKYQLKGRKNTILFMLAIFGILNAVAIGVEISGEIADFSNMTSGLGFWIVVAIATTAIATTVMFFLCGTGHVGDLLYKDSSYLMLTVPRHGWEILGGRFIAGLVEFLAYAIPAGFLLTVHVAIMASAVTPGQFMPLRMMAYMYRQVFVVNFPFAMQIVVICLSGFAIIGTFLMFAVVASRSFVKNKGIATAVSIAVFVVVTSNVSQWGTNLSARLNWYWNTNFRLEPDSVLFGGNGLAVMPMGHLTITPIPLAPILFFLVIAAILFATASWLMEKKVEL